VTVEPNTRKRSATPGRVRGAWPFSYIALVVFYVVMRSFLVSKSSQVPALFRVFVEGV